MCGITGFIDLSRQTPDAVLDRMTDSLAHRGPDGRGTQQFNERTYQAGFGHRRLAIIELSDLGKQPMQFGDLTIVFNGEIYNFREIRNELERLGHTFHTHSDTEVILHAYRQWQEQCVDRFIGMFAFVIYDHATQELFCARDRAGVKPFFYYQQDGLFLFASELKAFHEHPRFRKQLNVAAVDAFLQFGYVPSPHCIFRNTFKLLPGHYVKCRIADLNERVVPQQYWNVYDAYNRPKLELPADEAILETEKLLTNACEYRLVSDVPVGVFLSGGYDSTCVTALLQHNRSEQLNTYTIAVPDIGLNEAPYAKEIARYLGTNHHEYSCTAIEAQELIGQLPFHYDEPFADSSAIPTMLVSKMARKDVTVALSADAGDEVFAGYNRYEMLLKYGDRLNSIPPFAQRSLAGLMDRIPADKVPFLKNKYNFAQRYEKVKGILRNPQPENRLLQLSQLFTEEERAQLLLDFPDEPLTTAFMSKELVNHTPLAFMMAIDYQTYLPDDILQKVDRASMHTGLESREPFLDHRVIEWAAQLPDELKFRNGEKKWLLKEIVHKYVPKTLMDRPKTGFAIPIEDWLLGELRPQVEAYLSEETIRLQGLFDYAEIARLKDAFFSGRRELGVKIWYLLSFQLWFERWMK